METTVILFNFICLQNDEIEAKEFEKKLDEQPL
jgi:hypothetical protein